MNFKQLKTKEERIHLMKKLSSSFSERAAEIDQNGSFPFENIQDLVQSGYTGLIVPAAVRWTRYHLIGACSIARNNRSR